MGSTLRDASVLVRSARDIIRDVGRAAAAATTKRQVVPASLLEAVLATRLVDPPTDRVPRVWECLPSALVARCRRALRQR